MKKKQQQQQQQTQTHLGCCCRAPGDHMASGFMCHCRWGQARNPSMYICGALTDVDRAPSSPPPPVQQAMAWLLQIEVEVGFDTHWQQIPLLLLPSPAVLLFTTVAYSLFLFFSFFFQVGWKGNRYNFYLRQIKQTQKHTRAHWTRIKLQVLVVSVSWAKGLFEGAFSFFHNQNLL